MQVYPDQTNVTIDMINKYVKGSFSKVCIKVTHFEQKIPSIIFRRYTFLKMHFFELRFFFENPALFKNALLETIKSCVFDA